MYLSRLILDPRHPDARRDISSAYEMHRTLTRAFAANAETAPSRFLWRLEPGFDGVISSSLLVQSEALANWSILDGVPGYVQKLDGNKAVDLVQVVQAGQHYRFRIRANPTVHRDGKRCGLCKEEDQMSWFSRQVESDNHATLLACVRTGSDRLQLRKNNTKDVITVQTALFEGVLQVNDAEVVRIIVAKGIGHAKALGLGLLSLAPLLKQ